MPDGQQLGGVPTGRSEGHFAGPCPLWSRGFFSFCGGASCFFWVQKGGTPTVPGGHAARRQAPFLNSVPGGHFAGAFWMATQTPPLSSVPSAQRQAPRLNSMPFGQQLGGLPTGRLGGHVAGDFDVSLPALPPDLALQRWRLPPPVPKVQSDARKDLYAAAQASTSQPAGAPDFPGVVSDGGVFDVSAPLLDEGASQFGGVPVVPAGQVFSSTVQALPSHVWPTGQAQRPSSFSTIPPVQAGASVTSWHDSF